MQFFKPRLNFLEKLHVYRAMYARAKIIRQPVIASLTNVFRNYLINVIINCRQREYL